MWVRSSDLIQSAFSSIPFYIDLLARGEGFVRPTAVCDPVARTRRKQARHRRRASRDCPREPLNPPASLIALGFHHEQITPWYYAFSTPATDDGFARGISTEEIEH